MQGWLSKRIFGRRSFVDSTARPYQHSKYGETICLGLNNIKRDFDCNQEVIHVFCEHFPRIKSVSLEAAVFLGPPLGSSTLFHRYREENHSGLLNFRWCWVIKEGKKDWVYAKGVPR